MLLFCGFLSVSSQPSCCQAMSVARIHDKEKLRWFWEQRIVQHSQQMDQEENRMRSSALTRLREQWLLRLNLRNQQQQHFYEERRQREQKASQFLQRIS
ncbi:protein FAM240C-like [Gambusia affinis]|uniref:protein FAM240C-like n=1 Tax=Gambusia affinis TaxID=33528 RepID=UPI001CDCD1BC|nr:protein FAM240C-like [Gambusia affinis]